MNIPQFIQSYGRARLAMLNQAPLKCPAPRAFVRTVCLGLCLAGLLVGQPARADIAPPEPPPGSNLGPGVETTQVQMVWEKVVLEVLALQSAKVELAGDIAAAKVTATFSMRNQGSAEEQMAVRFPLANPSGSGDGTLRGFPEIQGVKVTLDQQLVATRRVTTTNPYDSQYPPVGWAVFDATFPPGKDVLVEVSYTLSPQGYLPFGTFHYILDTGAGWKGPIGVVDLAVRLPYEASTENLLLDKDFWPRSTPGGQIVGNEIRWHYENLEPTVEKMREITGEGDAAFEVSVVLPTYWRDILKGRAAVVANAQDGEAWGNLARALKLSILLNKGLRLDAGGQPLYTEAIAAYEKALVLQPKVAKWRAGYAELLFQAYYFSDRSQPELVVRTAQELKTALALEPDNAQALSLLDWISSAVPDLVQHSGAGYTYLVLTATPTLRPTYPTPTSAVAATLTPQPVTPTRRVPPSPAATLQSAATPTLEVTEVSSPTAPPAPPTETLKPAASPTPSKPGGLCGAAALAPLLAFGVWRTRRLKTMRGA